MDRHHGVCEEPQKDKQGFSHHRHLSSPVSDFLALLLEIWIIAKGWRVLSSYEIDWCNDWNSNICICYDGNSILLWKRRFYLRSQQWQATVKKRVAAYAVLRTSEFQEIKQTVNIAKYQNTKQISGDIKYNRNIKRWKNSLELCNFTVLGKTDLPALPSSLDLCQQQSYNTSLVTWLKLL